MVFMGMGNCDTTTTVGVFGMILSQSGQMQRHVETSEDVICFQKTWLDPRMTARKKSQCDIWDQHTMNVERQSSIQISGFSEPGSFNKLVIKV